MSGNNGTPGPSFEERLRAARLRQGLEPAPTAPGAGDASALSAGLRIGVELVSALAVATAIGWGLDRWLHTLPLFLIIFVLLGGAAGIRSVWRLVAPAPPGR